MSPREKVRRATLAVISRLTGGSTRPDWPQLVILGGLIVLWAVFSVLSPVFFTVENILNLARVASMNGVLALGMTLVIIAGGIDLSVGSVLALGGAVGAGLLGASYGSAAPPVALPAWLAVLAAVTVCGLAGLMSGLAIVKLDLAPFVVTLGMMTIARGLTYVFSDFIVRSVPGTAITFSHPQFEWLGSGAVWGIPAPAVIFLATVWLAALMLKYTTFGRNIYAVGGNAEISRLAGINTTLVLSAVYALNGALAGLSGVIFAARLASASPLAGVGYELDAIAAVVIGGTSMTGGEGGVWRTVVGVLIIATLNNGLNLLNVESFYQYLLKGAILVAAVAADSRYRLARRQVAAGTAGH